MPIESGIRRYLTSPDQESVLQKLTNELLKDQADHAVPDREDNSALIRDQVALQANLLLADAAKDFDDFEAARAKAVYAYGRFDRLVSAIAGALAAYSLGLFLYPFFPGTSPGLTPVVLPVLALSLPARFILWRRKRATAIEAVPAAYRRWTEVLRNEVLRPFILEMRNEQDTNRFRARIGGQAPPTLIKGVEPKRLVITEAMTQISATARNIHYGSLGISGPRGVGKSTILRFFDSDNSADLRLVVSAPVDYEPREFIIHLFSQLCGSVSRKAAPDSAIAVETHRHLEKLRYLRTFKTDVSGSVQSSFFRFGGTRAKERAEQPVTLPELVSTFREYSAKVAIWQRSAGNDDGRVVIGIDELDKIRDSVRAESFLNDIKSIFGVPGCLYIVSLSEDALAVFARRTPDIRDTFDSAFDEIFAVGPMTYQQSEELLLKRITGVPRPFLALCYVLAGGLPRDLVRATRALIDVTPPENEQSLPETTRALVEHVLESTRQAFTRQLAETADSGLLLAQLYNRRWPGEKPSDLTDTALRLATAGRDAESEVCRQICHELVVSLSFYATVTEVFGDAQDRLVARLTDGDYAIVDDLAAVRDAMKVNVDLAHGLLEQYRQRNGTGH